MTQPDIAGDGPALRPDVPVEEQVRVAAQARRRRRRLIAGGSAVLVAAAALLAGPADRDPAPPRPPVTPSPAAAPPVGSAPDQVVDVSVGSDSLYALVGSCAGPEQARECSYRLLTQTRGGRWTRVPLPLPPPGSGNGFSARLLLTGADTVTVVDDLRGRAYVTEGGTPVAVLELRDGPPLPAGMPAGLVPELLGGRVTVLDPATGLRRPLATQPQLEVAPRGVVAGPLGDLWAVADPGLRVLVGHSSDGGRTWRTGTVPGLRPGPGLLQLVPGQDGSVYLIAGRDGPSGPGGLELAELWWQPGTGGSWRRVSGRPGPRSVGSAVPGRSGLLVTEGGGALWRLSPGGSFERLPDPVVDGTPVRAGPLSSGAGGRIVSRPADGIGGALLLVSADDGDSWLPTLVPE
ncbi:MAG TPA: hypothetical protein VI357_21015 [Mycobacteriales bacterium]